jgi:predicted metal-dependent hydrolase
VLPPYAYLPRRFPHPTRDPDGHLHGHTAPPLPPFDPLAWHVCVPYLYGIDLFNHGYYWEAHEAWETVWHACGRQGLTADYLKGLIRLAGAGFKVRLGAVSGRRRLAAGAVRLFAGTAAGLGGRGGRYLGLCPQELAAFARAVANGEGLFDGAPDATVAVVFATMLVPGE